MLPEVVGGSAGISGARISDRPGAQSAEMTTCSITITGRSGLWSSGQLGNHTADREKANNPDTYFED
jgi:hypothetical protein